MKKFIVSVLAALSIFIPLLSGCGAGKVNFTLSTEGGKHYVVSCSGSYFLSGEYEIPAYYGEGEDYALVTEIADEGFAYTGFTKITVPDTVTKVGVMAFGYCYSLESIEFSANCALETFSHGMFGADSALKKIIFPSSVKRVEGFAFSGCASLKEAVLGEGLEFIGAGAFTDCTLLESIILPPSLVTIGDRAFYGSGLKSVEIPDSVRDRESGDSVLKGLGYGAFENCASLVSATIGSGITKISSAAFGYCLNLQKVYIPSSVKEVEGAYYEDWVFRCGPAFYCTPALSDVSYGGDGQEWNNVRINSDVIYENNLVMDNSSLIKANKIYSAVKP